MLCEMDNYIGKLGAGHKYLLGGKNDHLKHFFWAKKSEIQIIDRQNWGTGTQL